MNHWQDDLWLVEQLRVFQGRAQTKNLAPLAQGPLKRKMPAVLCLSLWYRESSSGMSIHL